MASEKDFELLLIAYPELIENGLTLVARQVVTPTGRIDLQFRDRDGRLLTVELKWRPLKDVDISQLGRYVKSVHESGDRSGRFMLVAPRVPPVQFGGLEYFGLEWREIPNDRIVKFLDASGDRDRLRLFQRDTVSPERGEDNNNSAGKPNASRPRVHVEKRSDVGDPTTFKNFNPLQLETLAAIRADLGDEARRADVRKWFQKHKRKKYAPTWIVHNRFMVKKNERAAGAVCVLNPALMPDRPFPKLIERRKIATSDPL